MPPDRKFVDHSLLALRENLEFLALMAEKPQEEFLRSKVVHYSAAHALMLSIEAAAGIAIHLLSDIPGSKPSSASHAFDLLRRSGVLSQGDLVPKLSTMSRVRDLIVHRYGKMDYSLVHESLREHLPYFHEFAAQIETYLKARGV